jgi:hypothetical protein
MESSCGFTSRRVLQVVIHQTGQVLVLALGASACPKNTRDLTFQPFVGNMDAGRYGWNLEIYEVPMSRGRRFFPGFICRKAICW